MNRKTSSHRNPKSFHYGSKRRLAVRTTPVIGAFAYDDQNNWPLTAGLMQSPVNVLTEKVIADSDELAPLHFTYGTQLGPVVNTGMNLQINGQGTAVLNGRHFTLTQFHFHSISEHTIDGKNYPLEAHFVHQARDGQTAAVAIFLIEGAENLGFTEVLQAFKKSATTLTHVNDLLPKKLSYYHYLGSLTTPPLTENVEWYLLTEPVEISAAQIADFRTFYADNHRHLQPLNARKILGYL